MRYFFYLIILVLIGFFPTNNHSVDAIAYMAEVKHGIELINPHHLLAIPFYRLAYLFFETVFGWKDIVNQVLFIQLAFTFISMVAVDSILYWLGKTSLERVLVVLSSIFCFGYLKYLFEVEVYIIPISFSLIATYFILRNYLLPNRFLVLLGGVFGSVACLFHQIHIFWYLGLICLLIQSEKKYFHSLIAYLLTLSLVLIGYIYGLLLFNQLPLTLSGLIHFVLFDFVNGNIYNAHSWIDIPKTVFSIMRTFYQIHGSVLFLLIESKLKVLYWILGSLSFFLLFISKKEAIKHIRAMGLTPFGITLLIIIIFQSIFAGYNNANAEFMVMLPFLVIMFWSSLEAFQTKLYLMILLSFAFWNISFGLLPNHYLSFSAEKEFFKKYGVDKNHSLILSDRGIYNNLRFYALGLAPFGLGKYHKIGNTFPNPAYLLSKGFTKIEIQKMIDSCLNSEIILLTDCMTRPISWDRISVQNKKMDADFFNAYSLTPYDSFKTDFGYHTLQKINFLQK